MSSAPLRRPLVQRSAPDVRRTIPFDYVFRFELPPERERREEPAQSLVDRTFTVTVNVSIEAAFVATSIGYGLMPLLKSTPFGPGLLNDLDTVRPAGAARAAAAAAAVVVPRPVFDRFRQVIEQRRNVSALEQELFSGATSVAARQRVVRSLAVGDRQQLEGLVMDVPPRRRFLGDIMNSLGRQLGGEEAEAVARGEIGPRTAAALQQGIRVRPDVLRRLLLDDGHEPLEADDLEELFETVEALPKQVRFLYAIFDDGSGRAFQSEPVLNVAGLGTADGERPFRHFMPPIRFAPRSTIRLELTPKSEFKGDLHVVLHGYKVLGGAGTPTGRALQAGRRRRVRRR